MGLFAILDMEIEVPKEELANFIIESIWKTNAIQSIGDLKNQGTESITFEAMTIFIDYADEQDLHYFIAQHYDDMNLNYNIYIQLNSISQNKYRDTMRFVIKLMENFHGNCILDFNGSTLLLRRNKTIIVDRSEKESYNDLPYYDLPGEYIESDIIEEV